MPRAYPKGGLLGLGLLLLGGWVAALGFKSKSATEFIWLGMVTQVAGFGVLIWWSRRRAEYFEWKRKGRAWAHGREEAIRELVDDEMKKRSEAVQPK